MAIKGSPNKNRKKLISPARNTHEEVSKHLSKVLPKKHVSQNKYPEPRSWKCWATFSIIFLTVLFVI